jgi:hypothetical protein
MGKTFDQPTLDRVGDNDEHNWNGAGCTLGGYRSQTSHRNYDIDLATRKFYGIVIEAFIDFSGKRVQQREIAALDITEIPKSMSQRFKIDCFFLLVASVPQDANLRYPPLSVRGKRPGSR